MATSQIGDASTFNDQVIEASKIKPVLVDFWATWCGPCRMLSPILDQIAGEYEEKLDVVKINADENADLTLQYNVVSIPTMLLFKNGEIVKQIIGAKPKALLLKELEEHI